MRLYGLKNSVHNLTTVFFLYFFSTLPFHKFHIHICSHQQLRLWNTLYTEQLYWWNHHLLDWTAISPLNRHTQVKKNNYLVQDWILPKRKKCFTWKLNMSCNVRIWLVVTNSICTSIPKEYHLLNHFLDYLGYILLFFFLKYLFFFFFNKEFCLFSLLLHFYLPETEIWSYWIWQAIFHYRPMIAAVLYIFLVQINSI